MGRLGFLANIKIDEVDKAIQALKNGLTTIEKRTVIQVDSNVDEINEFPYALNDFVIQKRDTSAMITLKTSLNESFLNTYWEDGLIVATPTGSSGYSLSCGGPFIFPGSNSLVITPIAAHNLTLFPLASGIVQNERIILVPIVFSLVTSDSPTTSLGYRNWIICYEVVRLN